MSFFKRVWGAEGEMALVSWIDDMDTTRNPIPAGWVYQSMNPPNHNPLRDRQFFLLDGSYWPKNNCCPVPAGTVGGVDNRININGVPGTNDAAGANLTFAAPLGYTREIAVMVAYDMSATAPMFYTLWPRFQFQIFSLFTYTGNEITRIRQIFSVQEYWSTLGSGLINNERVHTHTLVDITRSSGDPVPWFPKICTNEIYFDPANDSHPVQWFEYDEYPRSPPAADSGTDYNPYYTALWSTFFPCTLTWKTSTFRIADPRSSSPTTTGSDDLPASHFSYPCTQAAQPPTTTVFEDDFEDGAIDTGGFPDWDSNSLWNIATTDGGAGSTTYYARGGDGGGAADSVLICYVDMPTDGTLTFYAKEFEEYCILSIEEDDVEIWRGVGSQVTPSGSDEELTTDWVQYSVAISSGDNIKIEIIGEYDGDGSGVGIDQVSISW